MFTTSNIALTVLCPTVGSSLNLPGYPLNHRIGQHAVAGQRVFGIAKKAKLHRKAKATGITSTLTDQRQIGLVEGVVADQVVLATWQRKQCIVLTGREDRATGHVSVIRAKELVEGFPTYTELTGQLGLWLTGSGPLPDGVSLFIGQGFLTAPVSTTLFGQGDVLALSLTDERSLELGEGSHDRQHQVGHRRIPGLPSKTRYARRAWSAFAPGGAGHPDCGPSDLCYAQ